MDSIVSMTGRVGTEPDRRISRAGNSYVKFRLGTTRRVLRNGQWTDSETTWVSVRCYRHLAVNAHFSLRKGDPVIIIGRLRVEKWVNDAGVHREDTVLEADAVGHDLSWGTGNFDRGERRRQLETVAPPPAESEFIDPESGEVVDLASGQILTAPEPEDYEIEPEPEPEEAGVGH